MAIDLFCYSSLSLSDAAASLEQIKVARQFDYERDFILSNPRVVNDIDQEIAAEFTDVRLATLFLVRINNKSLANQKILSGLAVELKSRFADLLVLHENERPL